MRNILHASRAFALHDDNTGKNTGAVHRNEVRLVAENHNQNCANLHARLDMAAPDLVLDTTQAGEERE